MLSLTDTLNTVILIVACAELYGTIFTNKTFPSHKDKFLYSFPLFLLGGILSELKSVKVKRLTYEELMKLKGVEMLRRGRYITMDEIIRMLLEVYRNAERRG
jgi:hypothetical protein